MVNDPVEELRQELARRLADQLGVPLEMVLADTGMDYASIEALMDLPQNHPDRGKEILNRIANGMQQPGNTEPPDLAG